MNAHEVESMTIEEFIEQHNITMTCRRVDDNPNMPDDDHKWTMDHWLCTLQQPSTTTMPMSVHFSMGSGHNGAEPDLPTVLDCLANDADSIQWVSSFEEWASEMGYDEDSRAAERIYQSIQKQAVNLVNFLGDDAAETLLGNVERL